MLSRLEDELCQTLDGVWRIFWEETVKCTGYRGEELLKLRRQTSGRAFYGL